MTIQDLRHICNRAAFVEQYGYNGIVGSVCFQRERDVIFNDTNSSINIQILNTPSVPLIPKLYGMMSQLSDVLVSGLIYSF